MWVTFTLFLIIASFGGLVAAAWFGVGVVNHLAGRRRSVCWAGRGGVARLFFVGAGDPDLLWGPVAFCLVLHWGLWWVLWASGLGVVVGSGWACLVWVLARGFVV